MPRAGLILKLSCPDQPGIVAKVATYVAGHRGNLVEFAQFSDKLGSKFFARLEIETSELDVDTEDFIDGFGTLGRSLKADWHFRRLPFRMRTAVLVTKTDHCLQEVLWRAELNELPVEITSVIGNRDACRAVAERAHLPDARIVVVEHPLGGITEAEVVDRAAAVVEDTIAALAR